MGNIYNRSTLISRIEAFINRTTPFNGNALVQKTEDKTIREDVVESMLTREADSFSINTPSGTFTADFSNGQICNINTSASVAASFNLTISNLRANEFGKIVITKKSNDVFNFANASAGFKPVETNSTSIVYYVFATGSGFTVFGESKVDAKGWAALSLLNGASNSAGATIVGSRKEPSYRRDELGNIHLTGVVQIGSSGVIASLPVGFRPVNNISLGYGHSQGFNAFPRIEAAGNIDFSDSSGSAFLDGIIFSSVR